MKRILVHNQKGGVGKTTTVANLGAALARLGAGRVVLADLDPQMHLTAMLAPPDSTPVWTLRDWRAGRPGAPLDVPGEPGLSLVPGDPGPADPDDLAVLPPLAADWLVLDTAPHPEAIRAPVASTCDFVLCPLEADFLGLSGVNRLMQAMDAAQIERNRLRLLLCRFDRRLALHREVRARLLARFGPETLLPVVIRNSVRLAEAPGQRRTIFGHAPSSHGATDHMELAKALMQDSSALHRQPA